MNQRDISYCKVAFSDLEIHIYFIQKEAIQNFFHV